MTKFKVGDKVKAIKESHGWGIVNEGDIGNIVRIKGSEIITSFERESNWYSTPECLELVEETEAETQEEVIQKEDSKEKTIEEWFELLPPDIKEKAIKNTDKDILKNIKTSLSSSLFSVFPWGKTPEGSDYWYEIFNKATVGGYNKKPSKLPTLQTKEKQMEKKIKIDEIRGYDVILDKDSLNVSVNIEGDEVKIDKKGIDKLKRELSKIQTLKTSVVPQIDNFKLGDRVLLYGPTGTGKTYHFLELAKKMIAEDKLDEYKVLTITEGFEDIDFLAHIVPTEKGIQYNEKRIVKLLRDASHGKRVAILLDELNRGSKSFLNLILKLLDAVDGENYVLSNFVADETIVIPIKNVMFFAAMNLGGKYVGTNALDEALFDRFNVVQYKGYNKEVEADMIKNFGGLEKEVVEIIEHIRDIHKDGEIRAPISTRGIKMWAERFINTGKTKEDLLETFRLTLLNRLTSVDDFGNPNEEEEGLILKKFRDLGIL